MKTIFLFLVAIITFPTQATVINDSNISIASSVQENVFIKLQQQFFNENQSIELEDEILGLPVDNRSHFKQVPNELFTTFNHDIVLTERLALSFVEFKRNNLNNDDNNLIMDELFEFRLYVAESDNWLDDKVVASSTVSIPAALWLFAPVLVGFMGLPTKQSRQA